MRLEVSDATRSADPSFASMCDAFNAAMACSEAYASLAGVQRGQIAALEAEVAALRAQLSARHAA